MKNRFFAIAIALLCCTASFAQKDTCKIGIYINSIYDFKLDDKSFMADFWVWMNYKNDSLAFDNTVEITNSKSADFSHYSMEKKTGWNWATQKCRAQLIHQWDVSTFPFDKQMLRIEIEDTQSDTSRLIYMADEANSKVDTSFNSSEWCIEKFSLKEGVKTYQTTYGNPSLSGKSSYPRVVAEITIRRKNSWIKLVKLLTGVYVAFLISCIVFFVSNESQDSRFCLVVGGIFAAIGNKYIVESIVPSSTANTLMDNVHTLTFVFILLITVVMIYSLRLYQSEDTEKKQLSHKIDRRAFLRFHFFIHFLKCYYSLHGRKVTNHSPVLFQCVFKFSFICKENIAVVAGELFSGNAFRRPDLQKKISLIAANNYFCAEIKNSVVFKSTLVKTFFTRNYCCLK